MPFTPNLPENPSALELRSALQEAGNYLRELRSLPRDERGQGFREDVESAVEFIHMADPELTALEAGEGRGRRADDSAQGRDGAGSVGREFIADERYEEFAREGRSGSSFLELEVRGGLGSQYHERRDLIDSAAGGAFLPTAQAIAPVVRQRAFRLRDVLTVQTTGLQSVPYIREVYDDETDADFTAEGEEKNEVALGWESDDAPVRKVTAWLPVTTEIIEDAPTLRGQIDGRLVDKIVRKEEEAVLAGTGTGATLKGILNHTGVRSVPFLADVIANLGIAVGAVEDHDADADAVIMRPTDYWAMVTSRHAEQFDGGQGSGSLPFSGAASNLPVWGLPVVRTRSCPADKAIVGAFAVAATLFDRQRTVIRVGNQHLDFFTTNKVAIVAEERVALAVHRPDLIVEVPLVDAGG